MAARKALDRRPGPLPEIKTEGDSVTFAFDVQTVPDARLVLRCDANGDVYARIATDRGARPYDLLTPGE